jgi:hypothetical protein
LAGEPEVRQKPDVWKKVVIIGGAVLGGLAGWYFAGTFHPGTDIVIGVIVGGWVASWVWEMSNEESGDQGADRASGDQASGQRTS